MKVRENRILTIRNETIGLVLNESTPEEVFQNRTLRPILKFQNDLFLAIFINYAIKQKKVFFSLALEKKLDYIENVIYRDIKLRSHLKGTIIALFTIEEYQVYTKNSSNLNKRIINMLIERLKSQVQLLDEKIAI
jgi:hypothetical protein